jgi:alkylation response protein AidB-like acyl-CoA dehydrogenase
MKGLNQAPELPPLLGKAFPHNRLEADELAFLAGFQPILDAEITPLAVEHDVVGRYPTRAISALKRSAVLQTSIPKNLGGCGFSHRFSLEAQLRIGIADSSVAQIFKIHDELVREILVYCSDAARPNLVRWLQQDDAVLGVAVGEAGRKVDDAWTTICLPQTDGGFIVDGKKIYTTGSAEADFIAVWAFNPEARGAEQNPLLGVQLNLVPKSAPGVTVHRDWDALGQRATDSGTITFSGVKISPEHVASEPGKAPLLHSSLRYQAGFAAVLLGIAIGALRAATPFISQRSRPWPSSGVDNAAADPYVQRLMGELVSELVAAYTLTMETGDLLDEFERGLIDRTELAIPIYAAKAAASRASLRTVSEIYALMGTRSTARTNGFDRYWRNARTLSLHDPVDWKHAELGRHVLTGWDPPPGIYQ